MVQRVDVADCVSFEVTGAEALAGFPVIERDLQLVAARRQRADVDFAGQADRKSPGPTPTSPWATRTPDFKSMTCTARE